MLRQVVASECHPLFQGRLLLSGFANGAALRNPQPLPLDNSRGVAPATGPHQFRYDSKRNFHKSCTCERFYEYHPRGPYKNRKFELEAEKRELQNLLGLRDGFKDLRNEVKKWAGEWKERLGDDTHLYVTPGDKTKLYTFEDKSKLSKWDTICDSEHNEGFSKCELTISPTGKGLFHGFVNTTPPKDGRVSYAGYCIMKTKKLMKSFARKSWMDWTDYTHVIMRIRGDGRTYMLNLSTSGHYDITWNDNYHYVLYTRGGPYWQYVKIPFGKFVFASKGRVQDMQQPIPLHRIASLQILAGKVDGPFCLEIDYIGLELDPDKKEEFAYEMYKIPKFINNV